MVGKPHDMVVKLLGLFAIAIGVSVAALAALFGFLVTPWIGIGMSLFVVALLALHKRRPVRMRKGDLKVTVQQRAPQGDD